MTTRFIRSARRVAFGLAAGVALTGCTENNFLTEYTGPTVVEFEQVSGRYSQAVTEGTGTVNLVVNLIGPQQSTDLQINVDVVDGSTAVEGTHYTFPNGSTVTIPANASSGTLAIDVPNGPLTAGQRATLNLELAGTADGSIQGAENLDDFSFQVVGVN